MRTGEKSTRFQQ